MLPGYPTGVRIGASLSILPVLLYQRRKREPHLRPDAAALIALSFEVICPEAFAVMFPL